MIRFSKKDGNLARVFITVSLSAIFCVLVFISIRGQTEKLSEGYISGIAKENEYVVRLVADTIEATAANADQAAEIASAQPADGARYWFLLSSDSVIFERDAETTAALAGKSFDKAEDYYVRSGGSGVGTLFDLFRNGKDFSAVVTKSSAVGSEIISARFLEIGGERFCLGMSVSKSYMFSSSGIGRHVQYLDTLVLALCAAALALIAWFSISVRKKAAKVQILQNDLRGKNILVQEQGEKMFESAPEDDSKSDDTLSGLYNRKFFDAFVGKLSQKGISNVGIIYIRISNLAALGYEKGFAFTNRIVSDAARIVASYTTSADICARISKNEFAIVQCGATASQTMQSAGELSGELKRLDSDAAFAAGWSHTAEAGTLDSAIKAAMASRKEYGQGEL